MSAFTQAIKNSAEYEGVENSIKKGFLPQGVLGLIPVMKSHLVSALVGGLKKKALVVVPDDATAVRLCEDLTAFGVSALQYPSRSLSFYTTDSQSYEYEQKRIKVLRRMLDNRCDVVVASAEASVSYTVPPEILRQKSVLLKKNEETTLESIILSLNFAGYTRVDAVEGVGQFSVRGGIVDFFSPDDEEPVRIELWGDTVDTMCRFDIVSQRRTVNIDEILIAPSREIIIDEPEVLIDRIQNLASSIRGKKTEIIREKLYQDIDRLKNGLSVGSADKYLPLIYSPATIFDYAENYLLFAFETGGIKEKLNASQKLLLEDIKACVEDGTLCKGLDKFSLTFNELVDQYENFGATYIDNFARGSFDTPVKGLTTFSGNTLPIWNGRLDVLMEDLQHIVSKDSTIVVFAGTEKSAKNLADALNDEDITSVYFPVIPAQFPKGAVCVLAGSLSSGFSYPREKLYVFTYSKVYQAKAKRRNTGFKARDTIHSLDELKKGDYIVHAVHGIGIFDGVTQLEANKIIKDYIKIKYAKSDVLYVPVTQLDLVSKYIGPHEDDGKTLKLNRLGGGEWEKTRNKVRTAVKDMADQLIKLYSQRLHSEGYAFSPDIDMQMDFERRFPFEETGDQLRSIDEIKCDMEKPYPMDRLLCGDVGFGKTEVALRAVFKCIADGKQCAILVPTTILALQHYQTILKRFEGFPIEAEMLSRFRTPTQRAKIIKRINSGFIDIVVGTHSLISKNVKFKDLGLLIVDEEQRFGVAQKEKLKEMFPGVDVLTLSATPIPRTLNMAMSGIRDMSVIEEAPSDRFPVQTYVVEHNLPLLCEAMEKELRRGGQVYFLHNRVETIDGVAVAIQEYLPDARIKTAHGKMNEEELSEIWRDLMNGEIDILVCTTIIETGVDVPNANTLIIEDADRLGLAQLHQLRGRVGRSARRASAYLTYKRDKNLTEIAYKRLQAIREYTEFGSGFKIAMRDLEIRGAGNLLGAQQHGHLAAVGYDMYMKLLSEAISQEKGEKKKTKECLIDLQINAHIPDKYISALAQRLTVYRRIADIRTFEDAEDVRDELRDRFGDVPPSVEGLIEVSLCRNTASSLGIYEIGQRGDIIALYCEEINTSLVLNISSVLRGRVGVTNSGRKSINVKKLPNQNSLDTLKEIFEAVERTRVDNG
ncbi:MAG: transcription-repair coupling factor [Clostridia bacterium]|nr:transcription-repair coupling factor [Clostridia bacterium]